jgi:hypothetical protein
VQIIQGLIYVPDDPVVPEKERWLLKDIEYRKIK